MATDYSTHIADHFLEERAQLGAALFSLSSLADESLTTIPAAANLRAVQAHLRRPFVFLVVGEASAGKSSLLNALFGREFSDPDEQRTSVFKYGDSPSDTPLTSSLVERYRPLPFLRDFGGAAGRGKDLPAAAGAGRAVLGEIATGVRRLAQDVEDERAALRQPSRRLTRPKRPVWR